MLFLPILTLTLAAFAIGTTEFAIQGLLPEVAGDLGVGIPTAGLLVTGYALGVAVWGPIAAIATNRLTRKRALLTLLAAFVVGHVLCAIAPNYPTLLLARIVASFCHGAFMGIGSIVAVGVVPESRRASAVALMWGGIASANILGVPLGTAIGHAFGWRSTFWAITGLGAIAAAGVALWLPDRGRGVQSKLASELKVLAKPQVLLILGLSVLVCAATFTVFTFIAPLLLTLAGVSPTTLPLYLLLFGIGGVTGMQVGGRLGDRYRMATIIGSFVADAVVYLVLPFAFRGPGAALVMMFVWGFCFYAAAGPMQLRLIETASEAPNLASTIIQSTFDIGIAIGPFIGAVMLSAGFGYGLLPLASAVLAAAGAGVALWSATLDRAPKPSPAI